MHSHTSITQSERIALLDILRGFSLVGILVANLGFFSLYYFTPDDIRQQLPWYAWNDTLDFIEMWLVQGKFYSLFSFLFGFGFYIFLERAQAKQLSGRHLFKRRMGYLLLIGLLHMGLLWTGDILLLYALIGFLLPLFFHLSDRKVIIWIAALLLSPIMFDGIRVLFGEEYTLALPFFMALEPLNKALGNEFRNIAYDLSQGDYLVNLRWNLSGIVIRLSMLFEDHRLVRILAMFLVGMLAGRHRIFSRFAEFRPLVKRITLWGFVIGLPLCFLMAWADQNLGDMREAQVMVWTTAFSLGVVPLSLAYTGSAALLYFGGWRWMEVFAPLGRMALTVYLMQTVICVTLFNGWGFGLGSTMNPVAFLMLVPPIIVFQWLFCVLWLRYRKQGPMEWLWRRLVYGISR